MWNCGVCQRGGCQACTYTERLGAYGASSLVDTPAATVSFLGALVVIVCPALAVAVDKKKMGFADAPQTWIAAITCLIGVGVLELSIAMKPHVFAVSMRFDAVNARKHGTSANSGCPFCPHPTPLKTLKM